MIRRLCLAVGLAAAAATMACGSDQSTNTTPPPLTSAQLALHFDTLAGALQVSSPGDIRLNWYQKIAGILGHGVTPTISSIRAGGGPAVFDFASEVDAFADSANGKKIADSTYWLEAWAPALTPTEFVDIRVRFLPAGTGNPDTTATYITIYPDTTAGHQSGDTTEKSAVQVATNRGLCQITALQHLTLPSNPCTKVAVDWSILGGDDVIVIDPLVEVSGTHLTQ